MNGTLYGTTYDGGSHDWGTVYNITPSGKEKVLYSFAAGSDGAAPASGLMELNGTLYGTTVWGGIGSCHLKISGGPGCGTVYSIDTSGSESVLYSFAGGTDGMNPTGPLVAVKGRLYGTTTLGGTPHRKPENCCGTVFTLAP